MGFNLNTLAKVIMTTVVVAEHIRGTPPAATNAIAALGCKPGLPCPPTIASSYNHDNCEDKTPATFIEKIVAPVSTPIETVIACPPEVSDCPGHHTKTIEVCLGEACQHPPTPAPCPPGGCHDECSPDTCIWVPEGSKPLPCPQDKKCLPPCPASCAPPQYLKVAVAPPCPPEGCEECKPEVCRVCPGGRCEECIRGQECLPACPAHCPLTAEVRVGPPVPVTPVAPVVPVLPAKPEHTASIGFRTSKAFPGPTSPVVIVSGASRDMQTKGIYCSAAALFLAIAWL